jgi:hypothetical protein
VFDLARQLPRHRATSFDIDMGGLFSRGGKGGKGDFDIVIGQPDYNSFQKVTDAAMVKDYLQSNQPAHGPSEMAGPAAASKGEALPPPPVPREGEKAASKKTSSAEEDDEDLTDDEDATEEAQSNVQPAVRQDGSNSGLSETTSEENS